MLLFHLNEYKDQAMGHEGTAIKRHESPYLDPVIQ